MVADSKFYPGDDIVISGIGGAFPKAKNIEEFKTALLSNETLLGTRWKEGERDVSNKLGIIAGVEYFDTAFFGIHRHQASFMDPMQRVLLERTFEALVDAGVNPQEIRGKRIGVYTGSSIGENDNLFYESIVSGFGVTGHSRAMMANRISYWLNLKGPSCAYDSNWIGGIEVLTMAVDAVREGYCEAAIIGTANISLNSEISWLFNDMGLLSADGSTRAYDADATGYARGDGVIAMFIQRASEAKRIYASVLHTSTIFNGAREGTITDFDLGGMVNFIDKFYKEAGVDPAEVEYVETYGCGVKEIDEVELKAIEEVYCKNRKSPLLIGSVKPQTGHSEASATLVSLAKVLVAFESSTIPAHIQYSKPNPNIPGLLNGNLEVVTENRPWTGQLAAVHGIGLLSSYGHVLLRRNPKNKEIISDDLPRIVTVSTRNEAGIQEIFKTLHSQPTLDPEYIALTHDLFSKTISGHLYRGYTILDKSEEPKQEFEHFPGNKRPIWFIYSGMGSQWAGMATDLMKLPIFAESIMKSHKILESKGMDLLKIITENDPKIFDNILHSFVGIAAIQIALTDILKALGVEPDGIIGHSVGELGCSYADGCLTAEQMILCAYSRGKASLEAELIEGMMAAIGLGYKQVKDQCPPTIEVACHNSADSCTLSGPTEDMNVFVKSLQDKGIFARLVNVSNIAYHSRYIKPAAPGLLKYLQEVITDAKPRSSKWVSTSVVEEQWDSDLAKYCSAEYHTNNLLSSVLFEEGSKHVPKDAIAIEIAPHGLLQAILKRSLNTDCTNIPLTQRGNKNCLQFLLSAIGKMYLTGIDMNLAALYPPIQFPISRSTASLAPLVTWEHGEKWRTGIEDKINYLVSMKQTQVTLNSDEFRPYVGHELDENIVLPISAYLGNILEILASSTPVGLNNVVFENLKFKNILILPRIGSVPLYAMIQKGSGNFEILSDDTVILSGKVTIPEPTDTFTAVVSEITVTEDSIQLNTKDIYNEFSHRGHKYARHFKSIKTLQLTERGSISSISCEYNWQMLVEGMLQQILFQKGEKYQNVVVPSFIQKIVMQMGSLPTEVTDVEVTYNYSTGVVATQGLQIIGVQTKALQQSTKPISYHSLEFVPFNHTVYENVECIVNNCIHLVLENFDDPLISNIIIIETETNNALFSENIKNVLNKNIEINANLTVVQNNKVAVMSQNIPVLIVANQELQEELAKIILTSHAFGLVRSSKDICSYPQLIQVAEFETNGIAYSLIRKASTLTPRTVRVTGDVLSTKDLTKDSLSWISDLKLQLEKSDGAKVYLISSITPTEGITNFVQELRNITEFKYVRTLFLLDKKSQEFNASEPIYQNLFKKDLIVSILKDNTFGTYLPISIDFKTNIKAEQLSSSTLIANKNLNYIGINVDDETLTTEIHDINLGNIDYAGVNNADKRIMGLAKLDVDTYDFIPDPILVWNVPSEWSMEDACSVPHAYCAAYYCLIQKAKLKPGETVLIHNGCSGIGLAAISIAYSYGCTVFTTVATDQQRSYLKKVYNKLRDRNILNSQTSSFEPNLLMATGGEGAQVIVNCLPKSLLNASIRCIAEFGRFVQLGKFDLRENNTIGMRLFLKNTSFMGVVPEEIFNCSTEEKEKMRDFITDGLKKCIVRPIKRNIVQSQDIRTILDTLTKSDNIGKIIIKVTPNLSINYLNVSKPNQFICDAKSSYLIYGGTSEAWADMVQWLVLRGARKIVVSSDFKAQQAYISRRLNLLQTYFKADISHVPNKAQTRDSTSELLSEVYSLGPIQAVFLLPNKNAVPKSSELQSIQYIDMTLRTTAPKVLLVNFLSSAAGVAQLRADAGFPTYNVQWPNSLEFLDGLYGLDDILTLKTRNVIIKSEKADLNQETAQALYKKLTLMLPLSSEELLEQSKSAPETPTFKQVTTAGPRRIREVPPVFIIPGLFNHSNIVEMCKPLLHPTFVAKLPNSIMSVQDMATILAETIRTIYKRGPYNIIGVSWGGILAIEISKILQNYANTQVTFVDGAPDTLQTTINHLGDSVNIEINILSRLLNITTTEVLKTLNSLPDWESRLQVALDNYEGNKDDVEPLQKALDVLRYRINSAVSYNPTDEMIKGEVFLIRPGGSSKYDNCGLRKYSAQSTQIFVVNGDHISMLHNKDLVETINEYVAVR